MHANFFPYLKRGMQPPIMRRTCRILFLLLIIVDLSMAQDSREPIVRFSHPTLDHINSLVKAKRYKHAIDLALTTADQMRVHANWEGYISFMLRASEIETFEVWKGRGFPGVEVYPDYKRPQKYLQSLNKHAGRIIERYPYLNANVLFTNAVVYEWLDMPDTAELLHNQALELRKNIYGKSSREVADSYLWRGVLYSRGLQRQDLAEHDFRFSQGLQKKFMPDSRYALGSVYYWLAEIAMANFHFDEALTLANQYLSLYHDIPYEQAFGIQLIANVYWRQDDFEKSLESRRRAIQIFKKSDFEEDLIVEYSNLSSDLVNLGRYDEAVSVLQEGERILNESGERDPYYTTMLFENFGNLYRIMKKYDASASYFGKAMTIAVAQYGERNEDVADIYRMQGQLFLDQKLFESSLSDYQKMLTALIAGFTTTDYSIIPEVQYEHPYFKSIIAASFNKGDAFLDWFNHEGNVRHLEYALDNYRAAYSQIIAARRSIGDELSKPFLMSNFQTSVENSIACAHILYRTTYDQKYIDDLLYFVELTKYLNVLDALQRAERSNNSEVPVELLFQLESTRKELSKLQMIELQREHFTLSSDSVTILRDQILNLIGTRRALMSQIAKYSGSDGIIHDNLMRLADIQIELKSDEQIVEFFWGIDSIYAISLTDQSAHVIAAANDSEMDSVLITVRNMLEGKRSFTAIQVEKYSLMTSRVYQQLFQPVISKKKVIVIPDGAINLIPVEALVSRHQSERLTFKDLAYLIYDHEITYAYSSSILFHKAGNNRMEIKNVLGFSYSSDSNGKGTFRQNQLSPLPGTYKELETLSRVFKNVLRFTGQDAVKSNFISHAKNQDLIHLGVHGIGDSKIVDHSRLIFRADTLESGDLYAYDIYNLKLDAKLVVLSGCETGLGKRQTGEGIFSIARAFSYAGCPSVVMTMWRAADTFTAAIVDEFYERLNDGQSIGAALRESKLSFLEEADELSADPANWAEFVLNGQDQSFNKQSTPVAMWLILVATGVVLSYFVIRRRRMRGFYSW